MGAKGSKKRQQPSSPRSLHNQKKQPDKIPRGRQNFPTKTYHPRVLRKIQG